MKAALATMAALALPGLALAGCDKPSAVTPGRYAITSMAVRAGDRPDARAAWLLDSTTGELRACEYNDPIVTCSTQVGS